MKNLTILLLLAPGINVSAQVAIITDSSDPNASAMLNVKATGKGLLVPRMTFAQRPPAPATGLIIFQTDAIANNNVKKAIFRKKLSSIY